MLMSNANDNDDGSYTVKTNGLFSRKWRNYVLRCGDETRRDDAMMCEHGDETYIFCFYLDKGSSGVGGCDFAADDRGGRSSGDDDRGGVCMAYYSTNRYRGCTTHNTTLRRPPRVTHRVVTRVGRGIARKFLLVERPARHTCERPRTRAPPPVRSVSVAALGMA